MRLPWQRPPPAPEIGDPLEGMDRALRLARAELDRLRTQEREKRKTNAKLRRAAAELDERGLPNGC